MKKRLATGILGGLILGISTYIGGIYYFIVYFFISTLCLLELRKAFSVELFKSGYFINFFLNILLLYMAVKKTNEGTLLLIFVFMLINLVYYTFFNIKLKYIMINILGGLYIAFFMYHLYLMNDSIYVWYIYIVAFGNDTFAYFTGKLFGKHKLSPRLSPKKTIEGALGGIIGSIFIALIFNNFFGNHNIYLIIIFIISASILSIAGDLVASKIKRENNIKDYSNFLPGHGGFLDRFDSVILVTPFIYYFSIIFG